MLNNDSKKKLQQRKSRELMTAIIATSIIIAASLLAWALMRQSLAKREHQLEVLRQSEERTRIILSTTVDGIVTIDENSAIVSVNGAVEKIFGYRAEELLGAKVGMLMPEPFQSMHDSYVQNYLTTGHARIIGIGREVVGARKDGTTFPLELAVSESTVGHKRLFTGVLRDISKRKHIEEKLSHAYQLITEDLEAAAAIQKNLLPDALTLEGVRFSRMFCPSSFVAGDIFNYFAIGKGQVGFYLLDVSGHGVPAAMLSVSLSWMLSHMLHTEVDRSDTLSRHQMMAPARVLERLNAIFQEGRTGGQYITMVYGVLDCGKHRLLLSQAGLPAPILCTRGGKTTQIGSGGFPVGLMPDMEYQEEAVDFYPGDRLFLHSDGVTESFNEDSEQFSPPRLMAMIEAGAGQELDQLLSDIEDELRLWKGDRQFEDDVTLLAIEMNHA